MTRSLSTAIRIAKALGLAAVVISVGACGDLDDVTTVKDLRVLAVKTEPAGFLVPLDHPEMIPATEAMVTALVVDPKGGGATLTFSGAGCPDAVDTITQASGKSSTLCPGRDVTDKLPPPLNEVLRTTPIPPGMAMPLAPSTIQYEPTVTFGLTTAQVAGFFSPTPTGIPSIDLPVQYNRDFSFDAILNLDFVLGDEKASAIKRVVYWPLFPDALLPTGDEAAKPDCPTTQVANTNPMITAVDLFRHRVEGEPTELYVDPATVSVSAHDELFVQPVYDPASIEKYLLRVSNFNAGTIETQCRHELLTFQFFATAGTFSPQERTSELPPFLTSGDGKVHTDSQWNPPKPEMLPADGKVTIWVVARDERAGANWFTRTIVVAP